MEYNDSTSSDSSTRKQTVILEMETPLFDGKSSTNEVVLHDAPSAVLVYGDGGDYTPVQTFYDVKNMFYLESIKLWAIAAPIAFNIVCNYGINSFTNIFVGHIGDVELSSVAISLSVIANFSFGFLASVLNLSCDISCFS